MTFSNSDSILIDEEELSSIHMRLNMSLSPSSSVCSEHELNNLSLRNLEIGSRLQADVMSQYSFEGKFGTLVSPPFRRLLTDKSLLLTLLLGQFLSLMITASSITTEYLQKIYTLDIPELQTFVSYFLLTLFYLPWFLYVFVWLPYSMKRTTGSTCSLSLAASGSLASIQQATLSHDSVLSSSPAPLSQTAGWRPSSLLARLKSWLPSRTSPAYYFPLYFLAGLLDYEANFLVVTSFRYISVLHVTLMLCLTTPMVMAFSMVFFKIRYRLLHYIGVIVALTGIGIIVFFPQPQDEFTSAGGDALKGHLFCAAGALLYCFSNLFQEFLVKKNGILVYLGLIGINGTFISVIQNICIMKNLEPFRLLFSLQYSRDALLLILGYGLSLFLFYSLAPVFLNRSNATLFNLSLLSSNLYTFAIALSIFKHIISPGHICAFFVVIFGLILFNITSTGNGKDKDKDKPVNKE